VTDKSISRVNVRILEKEYLVACAPNERSELLDAAEYLSQAMRSIRDTGKVVGLDRIAVMAGLNIAHDMLKLRASQRSVDESVLPRVRNMRAKVENALRTQPLDL
jgi:cell division protein ZapA